MSGEAIVPYEPLKTLKPIASDLWLVDGPQIAMRFAGVKMPFPTRMTLVRLRDGALWVHSPVEPDDEMCRAVSELGPVRYLIAPNNLHYWWIPDWKERFPAAEVHAVPGLGRSAKRPLPIDRDLAATAPPEWRDDIDQTLVAGSVLTEADFLHRQSRTLILTDLIENFELDRVHSAWMRLLVRVGGAADPDGKSPIDMQLSFLGHRAQLRTAVRRMIEWAPERIILAHGRWYDRDATAELERAFRWVL